MNIFLQELCLQSSPPARILQLQPGIFQTTFRRKPCNSTPPRAEILQLYPHPLGPKKISLDLVLKGSKKFRGAFDATKTLLPLFLRS